MDEDEIWEDTFNGEEEEEEVKSPGNTAETVPQEKPEESHDHVSGGRGGGAGGAGGRGGGRGGGPGGGPGGDPGEKKMLTNVNTYLFLKILPCRKKNKRTKKRKPASDIIVCFLHNTYHR